MPMFPQFGPARREVPKKLRRIVIDIPTVHNEIDQATYKRSDAAYRSQDIKFRDAVASDATDGLDGLILKRLTDWRDSNIRKRLAFCLTATYAVTSGNVPQYRNAYVYELNLPLSFNDGLMVSLASSIDRYLVNGALADWYAECGLDSPDYHLDALLDDIVSTLRGSRARMPLQPFGPAYKVSGDDFFYKAWDDVPVNDNDWTPDGLCLCVEEHAVKCGGEQDRIIVRGDDIVVRVDFHLMGFDIDRDEWTADFRVGGKSMSIVSGDDVQTRDDIRYLVVGTEGWNLGDISVRFTCYVPSETDDDDVVAKVMTVRTNWKITKGYDETFG